MTWHFAGGIFDPLGFTKGKNLEELKTKEIKNARLAMLAFAGFLAQAWTTKESPLDNLTAHLSDPWTQNVFARKPLHLTSAQLAGQQLQ